MNANGKGTSAGWMGWVRMFAVLRMESLPVDGRKFARHQVQIPRHGPVGGVSGRRFQGLAPALRSRSCPSDVLVQAHRQVVPPDLTSLQSRGAHSDRVDPSLPASPIPRFRGLARVPPPHRCTTRFGNLSDAQRRASEAA